MSKCHWCNEGRPFLLGQEGVQHVPLYGGNEHSGAMCYASPIYRNMNTELHWRIMHAMHHTLEGLPRTDSGFHRTSLADCDCVVARRFRKGWEYLLEFEPPCSERKTLAYLKRKNRKKYLRRRIKASPNPETQKRLQEKLDKVLHHPVTYF
jgi:hypothetical protein